MTSSPRCWKILDLLDTTAGFFTAKEIPNGRLDAEWLLADLLGKKRIELYASFDQVLTPEEVDRYRERVRRRVDREPVKRIIGKAEFYSLPFAVADGVFLPRPETEQVADAALEWLAKSGGGEGLTACDACTGSGALAVAIARNAPGIRFTGIDIDPAAVACARENGERHGVNGVIEWVEGDCAAFLAEHAGGEYDLVVSNPPYITTAEMKALADEVRLHDPERALHGGDDGIDVYRRLIPAALGALRRGGALFVEVSDTVAGAVEDLAERTGGFNDVGVRNDYAGHRRVVSARKG